MMRLSYDLQIKEKQARGKNPLQDKISKKYDYGYVTKWNMRGNSGGPPGITFQDQNDYKNDKNIAIFNTFKNNRRGRKF